MQRLYFLALLVYLNISARMYDYVLLDELCIMKYEGNMQEYDHLRVEALWVTWATL